MAGRKKNPGGPRCLILFKINDALREQVAVIAQRKTTEFGRRISSNDCSIEAVSSYLSTKRQRRPELDGPLRPFSARLPVAMKDALCLAAAEWQLKSCSSISMNAVFNAALAAYVEKHSVMAARKPSC